jgi:hypothetical protein
MSLDNQPPPSPAGVAIACRLAAGPTHVWVGEYFYPHLKQSLLILLYSFNCLAFHNSEDMTDDLASDLTVNTFL